MTRKLKFTGCNDLATFFEIPFQTRVGKEIRCRITLPVVPSIPSFFMYDSNLKGNIPLADFMGAVQRIPTPTRIGGYLQFSLNSNGEVVTRLTRALLGASTSGLTYTSAGSLYSMLFFSRWRTDGWPPVWEGNIGSGAGTSVTVLDNPNLSRGGGGLRFTWRT